VELDTEQKKNDLTCPKALKKKKERTEKTSSNRMTRETQCFFFESFESSSKRRSMFDVVENLRFFNYDLLKADLFLAANSKFLYIRKISYWK
jgi:hypothetical protein